MSHPFPKITSQYSAHTANSVCRRACTISSYAAQSFSHSIFTWAFDPTSTTHWQFNCQYKISPPPHSAALLSINDNLYINKLKLWNVLLPGTVSPRTDQISVTGMLTLHQALFNSRSQQNPAKNCHGNICLFRELNTLRGQLLATVSKILGDAQRVNSSVGIATHFLWVCLHLEPSHVTPVPILQSAQCRPCCPCRLPQVLPQCPI